MNNVPPRLCRAWLPLFLFFLAAVMLAVSWPDRIPLAGSVSPADAPPPWAKGIVLRVGAPEPVRQATVLSPYGPGFEFELVAGFCRDFPCYPEWVAVPDKDTGLVMLQQNEIDVLVGFWGDGPNNGSTLVGDEAELPLPAIAAGKAYAHFNPVRVTGASLPGANENAPPESLQDAGETRANPDTEETGSPSAVEGMARFFAALLPDLAGPDVVNPPAGDVQPFPVFAHIPDASGGRRDTLLLDPASYALWLPFLGDVSTRRIGQSTPFRWFWRDDGSGLAAGLDGFWRDPGRRSELEELTERYFGFLPKNLHQRDIMELAETLSLRLADYDKFIREAAEETGVPTLLLVAAIYQESRFDPDAVSETRVRGIMQLTASTAKMLKVDRKDPAQCIMGGARYLRSLYDNIGKKAATDWDRWFMALGAYNQGMSNLNRAIRIARELGAKGDTWADVKRAFPLNTACRGREARGFVERIRYYNFILHGLVALAPAEAQDLAPLLSLAVLDGPI